MNIFKILTENIHILSLKEWNYLFQNTKFKSYTIGILERDYINYSYVYLNLRNTIWYPYSIETAIVFKDDEFKFVAPKDAREKHLLKTKNLEQFLNSFIILDNTTWEDRIEKVMFGLI